MVDSCNSYILFFITSSQVAYSKDLVWPFATSLALLVDLCIRAKPPPLPF